MDTDRMEGKPWVWGEPVRAAKSPAAESGTSDRLLTRSIVTSASPEAVFGWVCQLQRAPYSYDWIDNFGRRSPRQSDPALTSLEAGQTFMTIFELTGFDRPNSVTMRMKDGWPRRIFGEIWITYEIEEISAGLTRMTAMLWMPLTGRILPSARRYVLAWGDLVMMRKQLRTLSTLAERDCSRRKKRN